MKKALYLVAWLPFIAWALLFTELALNVNGLFALALIFTGLWAILPVFVRERLIDEGVMKEREAGPLARLIVLFISLFLVIFLIAGVITLAVQEKDLRILAFLGILGMGLYGVITELSREIRENGH